MTEPDDQAKPRKPVVHYVGPDEKIIMRPTPYTLGIVEGIRRLPSVLFQQIYDHGSERRVVPLRGIELF